MSLLPMDNQFFSGGIGLAALGVGLSAARKSVQTLKILARRHLLVTLEVTSKDASYPWVLQWLNAHGRRTQHLSVNTSLEKALDGSTSLKFDLVPGPGRHFVSYNSRWFLVERVREHQSFAMASGEPWEKVLLTSYGQDYSCFSDLLDEAKSLNEQQEEGYTIVYTNWGTEWRPFGNPRRKRNIGSVILDGSISSDIVDDFSEWKSSAPWYHDRGIPYRRGYLLHGPPGSGKTSFIVALAGHFDYNICILSLSEDGLTDDRLAQAMSMVPPRSIVLLEDVDAAFLSRDMSEYNEAHRSNRSSLTFSGLLNTLDGVASSEERIVFMTTNYINRLDPALMRPGRVDVVKYLGDASSQQCRCLFEKFYPTTRDSDMPSRFAELISSLDVNPSMADLQGYLVQFKNDTEGALENTDVLRASINSRIVHADNLGDEKVAAGAFVSRGSSGRRLSALDVDKVPFNPQPNWEEECGLR